MGLSAMNDIDCRNEPTQIGRIVVLYSRLSGYITACLRALQRQYGVELVVVRHPSAQDAPFDSGSFEWIQRLYDRNDVDSTALQRMIDEFRPNALYVSGWFDQTYLAAARYARSRGIPVVSGLDGQWRGTFRQWLGVLTAPWNLHPAIDVIWAAGERQRQFAARLGYRGSRCWSGVYACDWDAFNPMFEERRRMAPERKHFLFVGRYIDVKGLDVLVDAYRRYRRGANDPWPLVCVGTGRQGELLRAQEGIIDRGFVQPEHLPQVMAEASVFILPSRHEPWGVVLQEAAAAGLPLIASDACGAAVHLLQDGYNGWLFQSGDAAHLAECMARASAESDDMRWQMGKRSSELAKQFTPDRWAFTLIDGLRQRLKAAPAAPAEVL